MSPRLKFATIQLGLFSLGGAVFIFIRQGLMRSIDSKWKYFFDLDPEKWYVYYGLNTIGVLLILAICVGLYALYEYLSRSKMYRELDTDVIFNEYYFPVGAFYLFICLFFFSGNFVTSNFVGIVYHGESTEYGTLKERGYIYNSDDNFGIESAENQTRFSEMEGSIESAGRDRFLFKTAAIFEGYKSYDSDYKGLFGFIICLVSHLVENILYIFMCFTIPMFVLIVFSEMEYKK